MSKRVYKFEEGNAKMRDLLGGKGANLAEMTNLGLPVPQGFTISTEACTDYYNDGKQINENTQQQIFDALSWLEEIRGKKFGDENDPLLVSVRSGAPVSMPGMMDTILNLGLNDVSVVGFVLSKNSRFVVIGVYGLNTELGNLTTVCRLNSPISFFLMFTFALSRPNRKPSGTTTAALPFFFNRYRMTDMNRSAVSELARSSGKKP